MAVAWVVHEHYAVRSCLNIGLTEQSLFGFKLTTFNGHGAWLAFFAFYIISVSCLFFVGARYVAWTPSSGYNS